MRGRDLRLATATQMATFRRRAPPVEAPPVRTEGLNATALRLPRPPLAGDPLEMFRKRQAPQAPTPPTQATGTTEPGVA